MELLKTKQLTFSYSGDQTTILNNISFSIEKGEFVLLFGETGCGKSTLLKQWKPSIRPAGNIEGELCIEGKPVEKIGQREEASYIGYVSQNPDNQIVTDKVWHELAFTLENLGLPSEEIRKRVAEIAVFFGITNWFHRSVHELSGGQKQILNLASVVIARPKLLLMDEPTSQLDPITTDQFMHLLDRIHKELGIAVFMTEHRLEGAYEMADRCMVMDAGELICYDRPDKVAKYLFENECVAFSLLPLQARLPILLKQEFSIRTIGEAKKFIESNCPGGNQLISSKIEEEKESVLTLKNVWFRYEKNGVDVLRDFSISVKKNDFLAIVGANGQGKSTFLQIAVGVQNAYRGNVIYGNEKRGKVPKDYRIALLPQNPQTLLLKNTVKEELESVVFDDIQWVVDKLALEPLLEKHPYDLSGGQQQMVALAKVLLTKPNVLLLDEPTKGVDQIRKKELGNLLTFLNKDGVTIVLASHDLDFCASYARRVGMLFDGGLTAIGDGHSFFHDQYFYTTTCLKICREVYKGMIVEEEILAYEQI